MVASGDTLIGLARTHLGEAERWREIFDLNRDVLENPHVLPIGGKLKIPAVADAAGD